MNKRTSLDLFREALERAEEQLEAEMAERTTKITVTREQHDQGVARIMEAFRRYKIVKMKRRILISILAAVLAILTSCTIYVNRDKIAAFVEEFYHTYVDVSYGDINEDTPTEILMAYQPSYIPEGYVLTDSHSHSARVRMVWVNQNGEKIIFAQTVLTEKLLGWDNERVEPKTLTVNDTVVYYGEYNNTEDINATVYMWNDGEYSYKLTVMEDLSLEEIQKIITLVAVENE